MRLSLASAIAMWGLSYFIFAAQSISAATEMVSTREQDGIIADLRIISNQAVVRWRFLKPLSAPLQEITGSLDDQPLGVTVWPYPAPGERTRVVALLDTTGKGRLEQITRQIAAILVIANLAPQHVEVVVSTYAAGAHVIVPKDFEDLVTTLAAIQPEDVEPNLGAVLTTDIAALASLPAQRRGLFVFTDGHAGPGLTNDFGPADTKVGQAKACSNFCASKIAETALKSGIALTFILSPSDRTIDRAMLETLAARTGGQVLTDAGELAAFIGRPYTLLDSGATAIFPIPISHRYFWQSDPIMRVSLSNGTTPINLMAPTALPIAGFGQTATYLVSNHPITLFGSTGVVVALGGLGVFALSRRKRPTKLSTTSDPSRLPVLAVLQDTATGNVYPIQAPVAYIGRASTNEIALDDDTVSRVHAVLVQGHHGVFSIENKSEVNSARVNGHEVENFELSDGDIIGLGAAKLRFTRVPS